MSQTAVAQAHHSRSSDPNVLIVVMPGRLSRQASGDAFAAPATAVFESLGRRLSQFSGDICGAVLDGQILQAGLPTKLATSVCNLLSRTKSHAVVYANRIDERDRTTSSLAIAQQILNKTALDPERDTILLTGSGWDETDQPTDLPGYAFRGMGFSVVLDPHMRLPEGLCRSQAL